MSGSRRTSPRSARTTVLRLSMRVWDVPTRLFHAAVIGLTAAAVGSAMEGWPEVHAVSGYAMLAGLLFRLAWGVAGSETARFGQFLSDPLAGIRGRTPDDTVGHGAAGGWLLLLLLAALGCASISGLFTSGAVLRPGPLAPLAGGAGAVVVSAVHAYSVYLALGLTAVHVALVAASAVVKRSDVLRPMVTGRKRMPGNTPQPRTASPLLALLLVVLAACIVWVVATRI